MSARSRITAFALALVLCLAAGGSAIAAPKAVPRHRQPGWVPHAAWNAIKARAKLDLGSTRVRLYKTRWSRRLSKNLKSQLGYKAGDAFVVHVKAIGNHPAKRSGPYLAVKSPQGHYEAFPIALRADADGRPERNRHETKVDAASPHNNTYAFADGRMPASKVVQLVKAKNTRVTATREGKIVAGKQWGKTKTFFLLGDPNRDRNADRRDPKATATVDLLSGPMPLYTRNANASASGGRQNTSIRPPIMPRPPIRPPQPEHVSTMRTKFIQMEHPAIAPIMPRQKKQKAAE